MTSWYEVASAGSEISGVKSTQLSPVQRSISNPVSVVALSVHARSICVAVTTVAVSPLGRPGTLVSASKKAENADSPAPLVALTT